MRLTALRIVSIVKHSMKSKLYNKFGCCRTVPRHWAQGPVLILKSLATVPMPGRQARVASLQTVKISDGTQPCNGGLGRSGGTLLRCHSADFPGISVRSRTLASARPRSLSCVRKTDGGLADVSYPTRRHLLRKRRPRRRAERRARARAPG